MNTRRQNTSGDEPGLARPVDNDDVVITSTDEAESVMRKATYDNGDWYYGEFKGDVREGKGLYFYSQGIVKEYEGLFKNGFGEGEGVFRFREGATYQGEVKAGMMHGRGKHVSRDGDVYEGSFVEGEKYGKGVFTSKDGRYKYEGEYMEGKKCGEGTLTELDENGNVLSRYTGGWKNNAMHGQGVYEYSNGDVYKGRIQGGKRFGYGVMTYAQMPGEAHKATYSGSWRMDKFHGRGLFTHADGERVEDLMWQDGNKRAAPEEDLWWDDYCLHCKKTTSATLDETMMCCEKCPNVAHLECVNEQRKQKKLRNWDDKPDFFFCGERYASTGELCASPVEEVPEVDTEDQPAPTVSVSMLFQTEPTPTASKTSFHQVVDEKPKTDNGPARTSKEMKSIGRTTSVNRLVRQNGDQAETGSEDGDLREETAEEKLRKRKRELEDRAARQQKKRKEREMEKMETEQRDRDMENREAAKQVRERMEFQRREVESKGQGAESRRMQDEIEDGREVLARLLGKDIRGNDERQREGGVGTTAAEPNRTIPNGSGKQMESVEKVIAALRGACEDACTMADRLGRAVLRQGNVSGLGADVPEASTAGQNSTHIFTSFTMLHHHTPCDCPETRERLMLLHQDISLNTWKMDFGKNGLVWKYDAPPATREDLLKVHEERYLEFLQSKSESAPLRVGGLASLSDAGTGTEISESAISEHSVAAVLAAAGCVLQAMDYVHLRRAKNAFCLIRPPGHHAASSESLRTNSRPLNPQGVGAGFCLINNVLIGAKYAKDKYGWRVAVVDFDVHHGNGTEQVLRYGKLKDENGIMLCSVHQYQRDEFPGTGGRQNTERNAEDGGAPWIINVPINYSLPKKFREPEDMDSGIWRKKVVENILPHLQAFRPDLIIMSAGFDGHKDDPVGQLKLDEDDFDWITKALVSSKAVGAETPHVISVLEGGYGIDESSNFSLSRAACSHIQALAQLGPQGTIAFPLDWDEDKDGAAFQRCKARLRKVGVE